MRGQKYVRCLSCAPPKTHHAGSREMTQSSIGKQPTTTVRRAADVPASEHDLLRRVATALIARGLDGPSHVMLYGHGAPAPPPMHLLCDGERQRLLALARRLVAGFEPSALLLSVRILVAPPGFAPQGWHLDYRAHDCLATQTVFAALTPCTAENCTEMLVPADEPAMARLDEAVGEELLRAPAASGRVVQVASRQMSLQPLLMESFGVCCVVTSRLPHRRGPTLAAAHTRVVLNVDFTTCSAATAQSGRQPSAWSPQRAQGGSSNAPGGGIGRSPAKVPSAGPEVNASALDGHSGSAAKLQAIGFVDDDAFAARTSGGIVGRSIVDDLHSEVVVEVV